MHNGYGEDTNDADESHIADTEQQPTNDDTDAPNNNSFVSGPATRTRSASQTRNANPRKSSTPKKSAKDMKDIRDHDSQNGSRNTKKSRASLAQRQRRDRERQQQEARERRGNDSVGRNLSLDSDAEMGETSDQTVCDGDDASETDQGRGRHTSDARPADENRRRSETRADRSRSQLRREKEPRGPPHIYGLSSATVRRVSNVVNHRSAGGGGEHLSSSEPGLEEIDMDYQYLNSPSDRVVTSTNDTVVFDVGDIVSSNVDIGHGGRITVKQVVQFVVLKYDPNVDEDWTIPEPRVFKELLVRVDCEILENNLDCRKAFKWGNLWGRVGLVGLSPLDMGLLNQFRQAIENQLLGDTKFTLFPRDALEKRGNLSVLLRTDFRSFGVNLLPKAILLRSPLLRGGLRVTHVKHYSDDDYSRSGSCKAGWRLIFLQGCPTFMASLVHYDQDHKFPLGPGHIILRGGSGRPKSSTSDRTSRDNNTMTLSLIHI